MKFVCICSLFHPPFFSCENSIWIIQNVKSFSLDFALWIILEVWNKCSPKSFQWLVCVCVYVWWNVQVCLLGVCVQSVEGCLINRLNGMPQHFSFGNAQTFSMLSQTRKVWLLSNSSCSARYKKKSKMHSA